MRKALRVLAWTIILTVSYSVWSTQPGPRIDCYPQAYWDGKEYIRTGDWICF
jgi:hypothetical protein